MRPAAQPVAGVSAALSVRFGIDVTLVRVMVVVLCLLLTPAAYGVAWLLLPDSDDRILLEDLINGQVSAGTVGGGLLILIGLRNGDTFPFGDVDGASPVLLLAALGVAVWWIVARRERRRRTDQPSRDHAPHDHTPHDHAPQDLEPTQPHYVDPAPPWAAPAAPTSQRQPVPAAAAQPITARPVVGSRPPLPWQATLGVIGTAAIVAGLVALLGAGTGDLARAALVGRDAAIVGLAAAAAAAVFGLAMIGSGLAGRRAGWVTALGLLSATLALGAISSTPEIEVGNRTYAPAVVEYTTLDHGVGNLDIDLTDTKPLQRPVTPGDAPTTNLDLGVGNTTITVSDALAVDVTLHQGLGNVDGLRDTEDPQRIGREGGQPDLILNMDMGVGNLTVKEVQS